MLTAPLTRRPAAKHDEDLVPPLIRAILDGEISAVSREVQLVNLEQVHYAGLSPLQWAISEQRPEAITLLLAAGADVNQRAPLLYAATHGTAEILRQQLLRAGALVNPTVSGHYTPLHMAARHRDVEAVRVLVEAGADVNSEAHEMATPLADAREMGADEVVDYLLGLAPELPLGRILRHNRDPFLADLFAGVPLPAFRDAVKQSHRFGSAGWGGLSSLGWAAVLCNRKAMRLLVALGTEPDAKDANHYTPLMRAVASGASDSVRLLLELGADPRVVGFHGDTALHIAAGTRRRRLYNLLNERGADPHLKNGSGETAEELWKHRCAWSVTHPGTWRATAVATAQ